MAINYCDTLLAADIAQDCSNPIIKGIERRGVIINRADVDTITQSGNIVSAITLKSGKTGFNIVQPAASPFNGTQIAMEEGTYVNTFTNTVSFVILDNSPAVGTIINALANGDYIVILENKHKGGTAGNATYQIFGLQQGLTGSEITCEKYSDDTMGGWQVTLTETGATEAAVFFYVTSLSTTKTAFEALVSDPDDDE